MKSVRTGIITTVVYGMLSTCAVAQYLSGIDVSKWQGTVNWPQVCNSGVKFAFVKATEGVGYTDPYFNTNMTKAHAAGLLVGAYHFATPYTNGRYDAITEADAFVAASQKYFTNGYLRPVLDLEQGSGLGRKTLSAWVTDWMDRVKAKTGIEPLLYVNSNYANNYLDVSLTRYDLWLAHYTFNLSKLPNPGIWPTWDFWQWTNSLSVPGIDGLVDGNVFKGNLSEFIIPEPVTLTLFAGGMFLILRNRAWKQ